MRRCRHAHTCRRRARRTGRGRRELYIAHVVTPSPRCYAHAAAERRRRVVTVLRQNLGESRKNEAPGRGRAIDAKSRKNPGRCFLRPQHGRPRAPQSQRERAPHAPDCIRATPPRERRSFREAANPTKHTPRREVYRVGVDDERWLALLRRATPRRARGAAADRALPALQRADEPQAGARANFAPFGVRDG